MIKRILFPFVSILYLGAISTVQAGVYDLVIDEQPVNITGRDRTAMAMNGQIPAPTLRWREGEEVTIHVTNKLNEPTAIHWHGIVLPAPQDGVPGVSFHGIAPGATYTYRFKVKQSGTYWYHSHSGMQEQQGVYGPIVIEPARPEPYAYDRDYVVMLSDWTDEDPHRVLAKLKKQSDYYNFQKRTVFDLFRDLRQAEGWQAKKAVLGDRMAWRKMRMDATDIADVTAHTYTYLVNGITPEANWNALFKRGERVRLRFINGAAMTYFDVRIPGLKLTVVQADGQDIEPIRVEELRIAVGETYDVIVEPTDDRAYTIYAETADRSGYARATLAPRAGMSAAIPPLRERPLLTMADMGMGHGHGAHEQAPKISTGQHGNAESDNVTTLSEHAGHGSGADHAAPKHGSGQDATQAEHAATSHSGHGNPPLPSQDHTMGHNDDAGHTSMGHAETQAQHSDHGVANPNYASRPQEHTDHAENKVIKEKQYLEYSDLRSYHQKPDIRAPEREIVLRLNGNMERYIWTINGKKYSAADPIHLQLGERVRITFVNETMMNHPMHLHGMWMEPVNGQGEGSPRKHVVNVPPGREYSVDVTADALGQWVFHCHLLYHMDAGMMRNVIVAETL